ncbi:MAG: peptidyl-prolyl cis-trans isomerase [bacterium]|nr:peptidyl-prolyl cis-trans isomerase [bacterium]
MMILLLALCAWMTLARAEEPVVVATINGDQITTDMMAEELGRLHSSQSEEVSRSDFSLDRLLQRLISNRLLLQDAYALGIDQEKTVVDAVHWFRETAAYQMLLEDIQPKDFNVAESELRAGFERYYRRAMLRLICVVDSSLSAAIADSIHQGVSMASLSSRFAIDKFKTVGGDAGVFPLYDIPEDLSRQLETGSPGDLFGPMYLWNTWAVVRAEAYLPADESIYDSVKVILRKQLLIDKGAEFRKGFIAQEAPGIPVWVDSAAVDSIPIHMTMGVDETKKVVLRVGKNREENAADLKNKYVHRIVGRSDRDNHNVLWEALDEQYQVMMLKEIAGRRAYVEDPRLDADANKFRDSLMIVQYLQSVVAPTIKVSDAEIKKFFDTNPDQFVTPGRVRVAIITRATQEEAQADYEKVLAGADFTWIAKQYSIDEFKDRGGLREWASRSQFPHELAAQLDTMTIGSCFPPLAGSDGFVVMRLVEREPGTKQTLAEVTPGIKSYIEQQKQLEAIDKTLADLRANADITINDEALKQLQVSGPSDN